MLLEITDGTVSRRGRAVLSHFDFMVRGTEKIAVVGRNGAGKTTLLQLLAGDLELDSNEKNPASGMRTARKLTISMLRQTCLFEAGQTVAEALGADIRYSGSPAGRKAAFLNCHADTYLERPEAQEELPAENGAEPSFSQEPEEDAARRTECDRLLTGFGFRKEDKGRRIEEFSGGEQEKLAMIRLFLEEADLLLLDEPTNHLDMETAEWLESWLRTYKKAVVIVSHDRFFLDQTADVVYEIEAGRLTRYPGNYTHYRQEKQAQYQRQKKAWERQQEEIRRLQALITRFRNRPNKAAFARSRQKILDRMVPVEKPAEDTARIRKEELAPLRRSSKWVFEAEELQIGYQGGFRRTIDLRIRRGQKLALLGPNGSGKTTLLRTLAGQIPPLRGRLSVGGHADLAYFDQNSADLRAEGDVLTWFRDHFPALTEQEARSALAGYLFTGKDVRRQVDELSGGEKARLALAVLLEERPNVLLLDEPTNHMDLPARETIESILQAYTGTLIVISHDRYFIRQTAESLLLFSEDGIRFFPFGYEQYVNWKKEREDAGRDGSVSDLRAARTLKEQAMLESFQAVPGRSHLPGALSTAELARDWRLRELEREMQQAAEAYERADQSLQETRLRLTAGDSVTEEDSAARSRRDVAEEAWTESCLQWYEEFRSFHLS